eukprot:scaffold1555_cov173-Amphora_coffeaeformis.AAC.20
MDSASRYVLKVPRQDNEDAQGYGYASLLREAKIQVQLDHSHILALRGVISDDGSLILDRLCDTLEERLVVWNKKMRHQTRMGPFLIPGTRHHRCTFLKERVTHAHHLASAVAYLHDKRIVHRDIKTSNCGFDAATGIIQVFDFGLSKQLEKGGDNFLVSMNGSSRYMAPEITGHLPYTYSCDVYSFSIVLWEMLTCERAFAAFASSPPLQLQQRVLDHYERPCLSHHHVWRSCPSVRALVEQAWQADPSARPTMSQIHDRLHQVLNECDSSE